MSDRVRPRHVPVIVVLPARTLLLDVAGPLEVLRRANLIQDAVRFDVQYVGTVRSLVTSIGLTVSGIARLPPALPDGAMVVISGSVASILQPAGPHPAEQPGDAERIAAWLRKVVGPDHTLVTICSGALIAARAGLLDGYACTTHHSCVAELAVIAPAARVIDDRLYVADRNRLTSAGVTAGVDLMLHILARETDDATAMAVARYLVVYLRRGGADPQLSPWLDARNHLHPAVHRVQDAIAADPARRWTLQALARLAATSPRHLTRLFAEHAGMTVTEYANSLRIALARELLGQTQLDMERVAERSGLRVHAPVAPRLAPDPLRVPPPGAPPGATPLGATPLGATVTRLPLAAGAGRFT